MVEFTLWSEGKDPFNGRSRFAWVSRCRRWHVRVGNYGNMVVRDLNTTDGLHLVKGDMPDVIAFVNALLKAEGKGNG
jgi:hypothetical protein